MSHGTRSELVGGPDSLGEESYQRVRKALMRGLFSPKERVTIRGLAARLGVSTTPVRECVRALIAEGALNVVSARTVVVPSLSAADIEDIARLRILNEGFAADTAAGTISRAELDSLKCIQKGLEEAHKNEDLVEYLRLNEEFHFTVYRAARMPVLTAVIENLWLRTGPYLAILPPVLRTRQHHEEAIRALDARDGEAAREAIRRDIDRAANVLINLVEPKVGDRSI